MNAPVRTRYRCYTAIVVKLLLVFSLDRKVASLLTHGGVPRVAKVPTHLFLRFDTLTNSLASIVVASFALRTLRTELIQEVNLSLLLLLHLISALLTRDQSFGWVKNLTLNHQVGQPMVHAMVFI